MDRIGLEKITSKEISYMTEMNHTATPHPDVVFTEVGEKEAVLLHMKTKMYFSLNETGVFIWQLMSSGHTLGEISRKIQEAYDVPPEKASKSVTTLMDELAREKLIEVVRA